MSGADPNKISIVRMPGGWNINDKFIPERNPEKQFTQFDLEAAYHQAFQDGLKRNPKGYDLMKKDFFRDRFNIKIK